ncbi:hypothetical protein V6N13_031600 [Hibiscus sabdariffa]
MATKRKRDTSTPGNKETRVHVREKKDRTIDEKDTVDRISDLPDHVILKIMSSLPLKEAVRTCILSKRWKDVFTWISEVKFEHYVHLKNKSMRDGFMNFVDRFLFLRKDISLDRLRIWCGYGIDPCRINGWIHYALRHGVRELDLSIKIRENFQLQFGIFTCRTLETLKLSCNPSFTPSVPTNCCLRNLKVLHLIYLKFPDEESTRRLLSSCVDSLEEFLVEDCDLSNVNKLSICSTKLKRLTLTNFQGPGYEVEINTPNLVRLQYYYGTTTKHSFINLSSLSEARIGVGMILSPDKNCEHTAAVIDLIRAIRHMEVLPLLLSVRDRIPIFPKLTYLKMDGSYAGWGTLLAGCPSLETLTFDFSGCYPPDWSITKEVPSGLLHRVKVVRLLKLTRMHVEFIEYVLKEAPALESLAVEMGGTKTLASGNQFEDGEGYRPEMGKLIERLMLLLFLLLVLYQNHWQLLSFIFTFLSVFVFKFESMPSSDMVPCDQNYTKDTHIIPTPPNPNCVAPQMAYYPQDPTGETKNKGSGFWSGL